MILGLRKSPRLRQTSNHYRCSGEFYHVLHRDRAYSGGTVLSGLRRRRHFRYDMSIPLDCQSLILDPSAFIIGMVGVPTFVIDLLT